MEGLSNATEYVDYEYEGYSIYDQAQYSLTINEPVPKRCRHDTYITDDGIKQNIESSSNDQTRHVIYHGLEYSSLVDKEALISHDNEETVVTSLKPPTLEKLEYASYETDSKNSNQFTAGDMADVSQKSTNLDIEKVIPVTENDSISNDLRHEFNSIDDTLITKLRIRFYPKPSTIFSDKFIRSNILNEEYCTLEVSDKSQIAIFNKSIQSQFKKSHGIEFNLLIRNTLKAIYEKDRRNSRKRKSKKEVSSTFDHEKITVTKKTNDLSKLFKECDEVFKKFLFDLFKCEHTKKFLLGLHYSFIPIVNANKCEYYVSSGTLPFTDINPYHFDIKKTIEVTINGLCYQVNISPLLIRIFKGQLTKRTNESILHQKNCLILFLKAFKQEIIEMNILHIIVQTLLPNKSKSSYRITNLTYVKLPTFGKPTVFEAELMDTIMKLESLFNSVTLLQFQDVTFLSERIKDVNYTNILRDFVIKDLTSVISIKLLSWDKIKSKIVICNTQLNYHDLLLFISPLFILLQKYVIQIDSLQVLIYIIHFVRIEIKKFIYKCQLVTYNIQTNEDKISSNYIINYFCFQVGHLFCRNVFLINLNCSWYANPFSSAFRYYKFTFVELKRFYNENYDIKYEAFLCILNTFEFVESACNKASIFIKIFYLSQVKIMMSKSTDSTLYKTMTAYLSKFEDDITEEFLSYDRERSEFTTNARLKADKKDLLVEKLWHMQMSYRKVILKTLTEAATENIASAD